jgi:chemotaxis protein methyltransferase CheR
MEQQEAQDQDFAWFVKKVNEYSGIDLSQYKEAQMKRRLSTLCAKKGFPTFAAFYNAMTADRELYHEFLDRMTINVSEFWRNANRWETLEQKLLPDLAKTNSRLKCWSAACSTGEEPYTLAMILAERNLLDVSRILATDIDEGALEKAKKGVYPDRQLKEVPAKYISKYFARNGSDYEVIDPLKQKVKFARQNLLSDPFEKDFDLIICRNVLIYFTDDAKQMLYHKFSRALRPGGLLFVGSTEQIFSPGQYALEPAETFFYRKKTDQV